jgi:uncharacterized protein (TIGR03067 family)
MRWIGTGSFFLLGVMAFAGPPNDAGKDLRALQGTWQLTELLADEGPPLGKDRIKGVKFTVTNDKLVMEGLDGKREFGIRLDPSQKPKAIDITPLDGRFKGKTTPGIYEVRADTLRLCMANKEVTARPRDFKPSKEGQVVVFVLKRGK